MEFLVRLRPLPNTDGIQSMRAMLKSALRSHSLRCTHIERIEAEHLPSVEIAVQAAVCLCCGTEPVGDPSIICDPCKAAAGILRDVEGF